MRIHMQIILIIFISWINNVLADSTYVDRVFDSETSNSSSTERPFYEDTFSPGSIAGVVVGSFLLLFIISFGTYQIGKRRFYYLPYYYDYHPV